MGCGLSRPWRRQPREASVQSIRPLPESSPSDGEEEETPLLLAVREELCDKAADEPEIHGGSAICPAGSGAFALKVCGLLGLALAIVAAVVLRREPLGKEFHILHAKMVDLGNLRRFAPRALLHRPDPEDHGVGNPASHTAVALWNAAVGSVSVEKVQRMCCRVCCPKICR